MILILLLASSAGCFGQTPAAAAADAANEALHAIQQQHLNKAQTLLEKAVRLAPGNPNYAFALGDLYLALGKPQRAIPVLQKSLRLAPIDWDARMALAQAYQKVNDDADALRTLGTVPPAGPRTALWLFSRGFSLYRLEEIGLAEPLFKQLLGNKEMRAPANFFLANCYSTATRYRDALPYYEIAIKYGQTDSNKALNVYYYDYGLTLFKLGEYEKARGAFEKSVERFAKDPLPWYYLGRCEAKLGNFEKSKDAFEVAIEKNSSFNPAYYRLARLYAAHGDTAKAHELYGKLSKELDRQLEESQRLKLGNSQ